MAFTAAILGLGNIGRCVLRAIELVPDCTCVGVVRRQTSIGTTPYDLRGVPDFPSFLFTASSTVKTAFTFKISVISA